MSDIVYVGIAEYKILDRPGILACSALGSCVGVCIWDYETKLTGLLHALLPSIEQSTVKTNLAKFSNRGTEQMVKDMERRGAVRKNLIAKLVGGACLYNYEQASVAAEIGGRNVASARAALKALGIPVVAEAVGGRYGRSVHLNRDNFELRVNVLSRGVTII